MSEFTCQNGIILTLSDLHLGDKAYIGCPSRDANLDRMLERRLVHVDHVVLNGDIIGTLLSDDFSHFEQCLGRIERWTQLAPNANFHYILGNHDETVGLIEAIKARFPDGSNLTVTDVWVRCGDVLFTHGDYGEANEARKDVAGNKRQLMTNEEASTEHDNYFSHPGRRNMVFSNKRSNNPEVGTRVEKACAPFDEAGLLEGVSLVMLGHTHRTLYGYPYETKSGQKVSVYNTGGLITGADFVPMEIEMQANGRVARGEDGTLKVQPIRGQLHILGSGPAV